MKKLFTIFIGFVHDFSAGCWAASVLAVYWLNRQQVGTDNLEIIMKLAKQFFYMGIVSIVVVFATGAGRSFTYINNVYGENAEKARRRMLIFKHIFLFCIFGLGTYWQYIMIYG